MRILLNSEWITKRPQISGLDIHDGGVRHKKPAMPLIPLELDWQTMHAVPKYGIQIRRKTGLSCCSLAVKTFHRF